MPGAEKPSVPSGPPAGGDLMSEYAIALPLSAAARRGTCAEFTGIYLPFIGRLVARFPFWNLQTIKCVSKWRHNARTTRAENMGSASGKNRFFRLCVERESGGTLRCFGNLSIQYFTHGAGESPWRERFGKARVAEFASHLQSYELIGMA